MVWRGLCYKIDAVSEAGSSVAHARRLFGDLGWSCIGSRRARSAWTRLEDRRSGVATTDVLALLLLLPMSDTTGTTKETAKEKPEVCSTHVEKLCFLSSKFLGISLTYFPIVVLWCPFLSCLSVLITEKGDSKLDLHLAIEFTKWK